MIFFSVDFFQQSPWQKVTLQQPLPSLSPPNTHKLYILHSSLMDQSSSSLFSVTVYVIVSLLKGKFLKGRFLFYSLVTNIVSVPYISVSLTRANMFFKYLEILDIL